MKIINRFHVLLSVALLFTAETAFSKDDFCTEIELTNQATSTSNDQSGGFSLTSFVSYQWPNGTRLLLK